MSEKLCELARDLNSLIDIYGFGAEFSKEDLYDYFKDENKLNAKIELMSENELIIKDLLTNNYYFSNILTCNTFLSKYLESESEDKVIKKEFVINGTIKRNELNSLLSQIGDFKKAEITQTDGNCKISIQLTSENTPRLNGVNLKITEL